MSFDISKLRLGCVFENLSRVDPWVGGGVISDSASFPETKEKNAEGQPPSTHVCWAQEGKGADRGKTRGFRGAIQSDRSRLQRAKSVLRRKHQSRQCSCYREIRENED